MNETDAYFVGGLIIGILLGIAFMTLYLAYRIKTIMKKLAIDIESTVEESFLGLNVEKHDDVYRFYDEKSGQFIFQTTTLDDLRDTFSNKFPTKTCYVAGGDQDAVKDLQEALKKNKDE